jgi:uncharacterized membrane protein YfcA
VPDADFLPIVGVVLFAYTTQSAAGFGGVVLSVVLGAQLLPISALLPLVVPLSLAQTFAIVVRDARHVALRLVLTRILPAMAVGTAVGLAIASRVDEQLARRIFSVLVIALALRELSSMIRRAPPRPPMGRIAVTTTLLAAGVTHGVFASSGPLLVYAMGRSGLDKRAFRATLSAIFFALNVAMIASWVAAGRMGAEVWTKVAWLMPCLGVSLVLGEAIHRRVPAERFRGLVYGLLLIAGLALWR